MSQNEAKPRLILAASTGGHLAQLVRIAPSLGASDDSLWVTFDTEQSRSLLKGRRVAYVPYIAPRDFKNSFRVFREIKKIISADRLSYSEAVSTGSAIALSALFAARLAGIKTRYIESVSRTDGPSLSGRVIAASHIATLQTQHEAWADRRWHYRGTVMSSYTAERVREKVAHPKLFITLGTIRPYRFDAMVDGIIATGLCDINTVWQLGCTTRNDLPGTVHETLNDTEFTAAIESSDLVITHSGVGTILKLLDRGKYPVVVPRRKANAEHVDNHQDQIARLIQDNEIGLSMNADAIDATAILDATAYSVSSREAN